MRKIILIKEETIKKNPHAGRRSVAIPGQMETTVDANGTITITRPVERVQFLRPESKYLFRYGEVICTECGWKGDYGDLEADVAPDGEGWEVYSNTICPKCKAWDCLGEFRLETVNECFERIGNKQK